MPIQQPLAIKNHFRDRVGAYAGNYPAGGLHTAEVFISVFYVLVKFVYYFVDLRDAMVICKVLKDFGRF